MGKADIGIYGLGVMGKNLALNLADNSFEVAVFNRTVPGKEERVVEDFLETEGNAFSTNFTGCDSIGTFINSLKKPRKIILMVKAGKAVDAVISRLGQLLDPRDIIVDGGNSHFRDTARRQKELEQKKLHFVGMGVSGGEAGARYGPSLMPGGPPEALNELIPILNIIAAKDPDRNPCCTSVGPNGSGHFVKMVHNGIEYADMQMIAECYHIMKTGLGMNATDISEIFDDWNKGSLNSYLLEISTRILKVKDEDGSPLVDKILDAAGQKGTGLWTSVTALKSGIPLPSITAAVNARVISSFTSLRTELSGSRKVPEASLTGDKQSVLKHLRQALLSGRTISLAEGFFLIRQYSREQNWNINLAEVARIWQNGCIIRSELLKPVRRAFMEETELKHLLLSPEIHQQLETKLGGLRKISSACMNLGIPVPALSNALSSYDMLHSGRLPANLIQAQRDYFGAHTYERTDQPRGTYFHTNWQQETDKS